LFDANKQLELTHHLSAIMRLEAADDSEKASYDVSPSPPSDSGRDSDRELDMESARGQNREEELTLQVSRTESIWVAQALSLPHEAALVFIICMAQFSTRKLVS
jgi:hypothetical protein